MRRMLALLLMVAGIASAQPLAGAGDVLPDLKPLGKGEMRWFGFKLYDASLWASGGTYSPDGGFALSIRYARSFDGERLAGASVDEIKRLGGRQSTERSAEQTAVAVFWSGNEIPQLNAVARAVSPSPSVAMAVSVIRLLPERNLV